MTQLCQYKENLTTMLKAHLLLFTSPLFPVIKGNFHHYLNLSLGENCSFNTYITKELHIF